MRRILLTLLFLLLLAGTSQAAGNRSHVILLDQSGSMEESGYYGAGGPLESFARELISTNTVFQDKDSVHVGLFSANTAAIPSPAWLPATTGAKARAQFDSEIKPKLKSVANYTNLVETLDAGRKQLAQAGKSTGILWLLTDNVDYTPGGTEGDTETFYAHLAKLEDVRRVYVIPLLFKPTDKQGLVLYAIQIDPAGSQDATDEMERMIGDLKNSPLVKKWGQPPILAKPLDQNVVAIQVVSFTPAAGLPVTMEQDEQTGTIRLKGYKEGQRLAGSLQVRIVSRYEMLRIDDAKLQVQMPPLATRDFTVSDIASPKITPTQLQNLPAGQTAAPTYRIDFDVPPLKSRFSVGGLRKFAGDVTGEIRLVLTDPVLSLDLPKGDERFHKIQMIPHILAQDITTITADHPVQFTVAFPVARIVIAFAVIIGGLLLLAFVIWRAASYRVHYHLAGAGIDEYMTFGLFGGSHGTDLGSVRRRFLGQPTFATAEGETVPLLDQEFRFRDSNREYILSLTEVTGEDQDEEGGYANDLD